MSTDKHRLIPITDLHTPELEIYNERREVQLFHYYEPERGLFIAESPNVILRALAADTIADCDDTVCIPMAHGVDSLNVAAASAVAFWELCK